MNKIQSQRFLTRTFQAVIFSGFKLSNRWVPDINNMSVVLLLVGVLSLKKRFFHASFVINWVLWSLLLQLTIFGFLYRTLLSLALVGIFYFEVHKYKWDSDADSIKGGGHISNALTSFQVPKNPNPSRSSVPMLFFFAFLFRSELMMSFLHLYLL